MNSKLNKLTLFFGGTFDPPHHGHALLPQMAMKILNAQKIIYSITPLSPHKLNKPPVHYMHRFKMLKLMLKEYENSFIDTWEIENKRNKTKGSFTIDAVLRYANENKTERLNLLIGDDQAVKLHTWKDYKELIKISPPAIMLRKYESKESLQREILKKTNNANWAIYISNKVINIPKNTLNSTLIRNTPINNLSSLHLSPCVQEYIKIQKLYH